MVKFITVILFMLSINGFSQGTPQYVIHDVTYDYEIEVGGVTDADDVKLPMSLIFDLFGVMPVYEQDSPVFYITTRKNKSISEITNYLEDHEVEVLHVAKRATDRTSQNPE